MYTSGFSKSDKYAPLKLPLSVQGLINISQLQPESATRLGQNPESLA